MKAETGEVTKMAAAATIPFWQEMILLSLLIRDCISSKTRHRGRAKGAEHPTPHDVGSSLGSQSMFRPGGKYLTCLFCGSRSDLTVPRARPLAYFYGPHVLTGSSRYILCNRLLL